MAHQLIWLLAMPPVRGGLTAALKSIVSGTHPPLRPATARGLGNGAVQVYLPRRCDKLRTRGNGLLALRVLEGTGGHAELQRRAGKLPHTFHFFQPLLSLLVVACTSASVAAISL